MSIPEQCRHGIHRIDCEDCNKAKKKRLRTPMEDEMKTKEVERDSIGLKWGTLKSWNIKTKKTFELLKQYHALGASMSAMTQHDTPEQKRLICEMIDECNAESIYLDWEGKNVSKEEAKKYIMKYGAKK